MINTMPLEQAVRANEPRELFGAADVVYRNVKSSADPLRLPTLAPVPSPGLGEGTKKYFRHLERKAWIAFGTIYASLLVGCFAFWNLAAFLVGQTYWLHPFISINLLVASFGLTLVAVIVLWTIFRYFRKVVAAP